MDEFKANIALLDENSEDYKAYVAAIDNTIEAAKAYDKAYEEYKLEVIACADLQGKKSVAEGLLTGNPDINVKIAECEEKIAEAEAIKAVAGEVNYRIEISFVAKTADSSYTDSNGHSVNPGDYIDENGNWVEFAEDAATIRQVNRITVNVEAYYKECELEVENLKSEIEAQKLIVAQCKAELEAAINSGATDNTPAEETPAE